MPRRLALELARTTLPLGDRLTAPRRIGPSGLVALTDTSESLVVKRLD